jgi:hypothetical protein
VTCGGQVLARHQRCWDVHQTLTDPAHAQAAAEMRRSRLHVTAGPADAEVEQRCLSDYDALLGTEGAA